MNAKTIYSIDIEIVANPDIRGGFWRESRETTTTLLAKNLKDLQKKFKNFLDKNEYGGGNLYKADVYKYCDEELHYIGRFSYNGRLWDTNDKEILI